MSSITKNESELISYRTLVTSSQLSINIIIDKTGSVPNRQNGGSDTVLQAFPDVRNGGEDDNLTLKNSIEDAN